jgi:orotate phosphoribosyltransferase
MTEIIEDTYTQTYRKKQLVGMLYALGAIKRGSFTLSSGKTSSYYIDGRLAVLDPKTLMIVAHMMGSIISPYESDSIGCMEGPGSACLLGSLLAGYASRGHEKQISGFVVRKRPKSHGITKMVEGVVGNHPVLIDDVATSGKSLLHAMDHMGVKPLVTVVMLNREEGAAEALQERGVELKSVLTMDDLVV